MTWIRSLSGQIHDHQEEKHKGLAKLCYFYEELWIQKSPVQLRTGLSNNGTARRT